MLFPFHRDLQLSNNAPSKCGFEKLIPLKFHDIHEGERKIAVFLISNRYYGFGEEDDDHGEKRMRITLSGNHLKLLTDMLRRTALVAPSWNLKLIV